jgi:cytoskeletal protein RodZ
MAESIGQQLQQARRARSLSLEQVARATHLRVHYLQALESDDLPAIPSLAQARGFLRIYAAYLDLDAASMLAALEGNNHPIPAQPVDVPPTPSLASLEHSAAAAALYNGIGRTLREQREVLGLSLEDVEKYTHLRGFYLKALEAGEFDRLPSPVQGRGMLSNYAEFLGMNPEPLLLKFAEGLQARLAERKASQPARPRPAPGPKSPPSRMRRFFSTELILGGALVLLLAGFALWAAIRIYTLQGEQQPAPTPPPIAAVLLVTPSETPSPTVVPPTATIGPPVIPTQQATEGTAQPTLLPPATSLSVQVYITVRQRAWMRVLVDGEVEFEGRVIPGSAYQYTGEDKVEILTGNGAALQVFYNSFDLGPIGLFGEVIHQVYTLEGLQTPTPTITLTPTETERPTRTPFGASAASATPQVTPTP